MKKWADKVMELAVTERKKQADYRAERTRLNERYSGPDRMYPMSAFAPPTPASEHPPYGLPAPGSMYPQSGYFPSMEEEEDESGFRTVSARPRRTSRRPLDGECRASRRCRRTGKRTCVHGR